MTVQSLEVYRSVQSLIDGLVKKYKYKPLPEELSQKVRTKYREALPHWLKEEGDLSQPLYSPEGIQLCSGYMRIVIGDYGAFIEIPQVTAHKFNFIVKPGQEYRFRDPKYKDRVKYVWLTTPKHDIKIYSQMKTVPYADYLIEYFYVSPYEVQSNV